MFADIAAIVAAVPSFGISIIVKEIGKQLMQKSSAIILTLAVGGIISFIAPLAARTLGKSLIKNMVGEDAAYAINSGFHMYTAKQLQTSSGLPATEETLIAEYEETQKVIANEARFVRETKSPLDPSSPYTFLGSFIKSLTPIASSMSSPLQTFSKISSAVGSSISSLMPTASADDVSKIKTSINKNCPSANAFGKPLAMDAYCNNYITTDFSTIRNSPDEIIDHVGAENFDIDNIDENINNGNPEVKDNSELAKWILSCAARESHYGVADSGISEAIAGAIGVGKGFLKMVTGTAIGIIPIVGSFIQGLFDSREAANIGWITGENCANEQYKYFSRYSEDQRVLESAGLIEKSAVTAFLDRYYEKNPLDFSDSGIVARYTGMSKEQAEIGLGLLEYNQFLAQHRPKKKGPEVLPTVQEYQYESTTVIAEILPSSLVRGKNTLPRRRLSFVIA